MKNLNFSILLIICLLASSSQVIKSQTKKITLDNIYRENIFGSRSVQGINSMNDGKHYTVNNRGKTIDKHAYADGEQTAVLFDASDHDYINSFSSYTFSADEKFILLTTNVERIYRRSFLAEYFIYNMLNGELTVLSSGGKQQLAAFSPDNRHVAFVRENNIYLTELATKNETQVTFDGKKNEIINGAPDWVYEEEFGFADGFKWSPDGKKIAYYRFDETRVKEYFMTMFGDLYPEAYTFKYPKAGETNSDVSIRVLEIENSRTTTISLPDDEEFYIPRIKWTNDTEVLSLIWLNRLQNHVKVLHWNAVNGETKAVYEEHNEKYISEATDNMVTYLPDNKSFLLISERDGYFHFYLHNFITGETHPVTSGAYDISSLQGVDKKRGIVYYTSYEESSTTIHLYSIKMDGTGKKKISGEPGSYSATFSSSFDYYILSRSNANTPPVYALYNRKGKQVRILEDNAELKRNTEEFGFSPIEFMQVPTVSGQNLNGYMIKPANFDPARQYPLFIYVYGGPESQNVVDSWNRRSPWFQLLVQEGYIVACVDNRGTNGRGEEFRKSTYLQMGNLETIDQVEAATYLGDLDYIDSKRIGIFGWSYGGFMTSLCLTKGNGLFKMGIAGAPVTNWRYYDTIYTERFMRTPRENPHGYDDNSPINFAGQLKGKLLLIHGTADDNVHLQNSVDFVSALVEADKQFDMFFYPNKSHGIYGGNSTFHLYTRMTDFILENL
ncbi:MAG: S9 family peptidase [Bacteroidales bacterium]